MSRPRPEWTGMAWRKRSEINERTDKRQEPQPLPDDDRSLTASICGDPLPGRSDRRSAPVDIPGTPVDFGSARNAVFHVRSHEPTMGRSVISCRRSQH